MSEVCKKITDILKTKGFVEKVIADGKSEEKYEMDLSFLGELKDCKEEKKYVSVRKVHYRDEYHDEDLNQVQAIIYTKRTGLNTVKKLAESVLDEYYGQTKEYNLTPEFIWLVVPAIEFNVDGKKVAAGGLVRPDELDKYNIDSNEYSVCALCFVEESF